jgi:hypothetical protein
MQGDNTIFVGLDVHKDSITAGRCGFWLHRYLSSKGVDCVVVVPSLIPQRPGDRIKTDRRDARSLALGLRAGTPNTVHVPTPTQEASRDVVRAWQQSKRERAGTWRIDAGYPGWAWCRTNTVPEMLAGKNRSRAAAIAGEKPARRGGVVVPLYA